MPNFCIPQVLPEFDFSAHKYFPVVKIIWFCSAARVDSRESSRRPSAIKNVPAAEQVCNGPDPVHVWTMCLIHLTVRLCKGVFHTPSFFFFFFFFFSSPEWKMWLKKPDQRTHNWTLMSDNISTSASVYVCFVCVCLCVCACASGTQVEVLLSKELAN